MSHNTSQITHLDLCLSLSLSCCLLVFLSHTMRAQATLLLCLISSNIALSPRFLSLTCSASYLRTALVKAPYLLCGPSFMALL